MKVSSIFKTLIVVVACIMLGAFVLNTLMPNVVETGINAVEDGIYKATGMSFDLNKDGVSGKNNNNYSGTHSAGSETGVNGGNVDGFN